MEFDGIWIDMNECSNFCAGECPSSIEMSNELEVQDGNHDPTEFNDLPYLPAYSNPNDKTLSMTGYHYAKD